MIIGYFNYDASVLKEQGNIFTLYKGYLLKDVKSEINIPFILGLITSVPSITGFFLFKDK